MLEDTLASTATYSLFASKHDDDYMSIQSSDESSISYCNLLSEFLEKGMEFPIFFVILRLSFFPVKTDQFFLDKDNLKEINMSMESSDINSDATQVS